MKTMKTTTSKTTNIESIKGMAKNFLYLEPNVIPEMPFLIQHPFFDYRLMMLPDKQGIDIIDEPEKFNELRKKYEEQIDNADLSKLFAMILDKYHLTFLKFVKDYMSNTDFSQYLAYAWVNSENPNQDVNVSVKELIKWFKETDRKALMSEEEFAYYNKLPDIVQVYRGVAVGRAETVGLSWTCNYKTAAWFAGRFNSGNQFGYILCAKVRKEDVFAYFNGRGEDEILLNSSRIFDVEKENLFENG